MIIKQNPWRGSPLRIIHHQTSITAVRCVALVVGLLSSTAIG